MRNNLIQNQINVTGGGLALVVTRCSINEVTLRRARLVLEWVTVCGLVNHLSM